MTELNRVKLILFKIKMLIGEGKCSFEEQREKNMRTLIALGLLPEDVFEILSGLTAQNYFYIKLKLTSDFAKDISFHFAEKEMAFPYKKD